MPHFTCKGPTVNLSLSIWPSRAFPCIVFTEELNADSNWALHLTMKGERVKAMQTTDQNSSNPYAEYIDSIESSSKWKRSSSSSSSSSSSLRRGTSGVPTTSLDPILDFSNLKDKNTQEALDLVSARRAYELCKTPEEKSALKAHLQPIIISRLKKLSEMEQRTSVGDEIADAVDFLKSLNPSDPRFVEIGKISQTSRKGVISLQEGMMQLKEAQDQLLSQLRSLSPHDNKDH
ncbi:uncharacterized protein LOC120004570 [Tripterygium wilfordii]|uniref:uncharacterized protein LOC120004570 n=1 Tax=Tripterygium wilfordii TaxID=458696 RepID=UPI0018F80C7C|nr:uncharacterized protein LOC120004570 [Tripterygium wilfordii]